MVTLRPVRALDAADVRDITAYDGKFAATVAEAAAMLRRIDDDQARGESAHWGICPAGSDRVVGTCGYYRGFAGAVGEIGYVLSEPFRGRGLMTETVGLVARFGFEVMALREVVAYTEPTNAGSIGVLTRCGFRETPSRNGLLRFSLGPGGPAPQRRSGRPPYPG